MNRKAAIFLLFFLLVPLLGFAQAASTVSADKFFADLAAGYGKIKDYEAALTITRGKTVESGRISYKSPLSLNIKFDNPAGQVLNFDGEKLTFYSPADQVVMEQDYKKRSPSQLESMALGPGLVLWQANYSVAFLTGPDAVPLEEGSAERVVKLKLQARSSTSYSEMILSVKDKAFIRRVEGTLTSGDKVVMDFTNIRINQGLPDARFQYDAPPLVNVIKNWLFDPEE